MMADDLTYENVVSTLVREAPGLRPLYEEHCRDYDEVLPHVFFGDVKRFVAQAFEAAKSSADNRSLKDAALKILSVLERAMGTNDERLRELVSVSFLENLDQKRDTYCDIRQSLGPRMRKELEAYE
jgi:hypothetical protein